MKLRLRITLTLNLQRSPRAEGQGDAPHIDDKPGSITETAWPAPVGFAITPTSTQPRTDER